MDQPSPISRGLPKHRRELDRWLRSALMDPKRAAAYGVRAMPAHEVEAFLGHPAGPGIGFEYRGELHRVRLLEPGDGPKYLQPQGSAIRVLEPLGHERSSIWDDPGAFAVLFLTEGEKKAHALTALGYPCLGIGGVPSWSAAQGSRRLHPTIEKHRAKAQRVVVVFDSDAASNDQVAQQEAALVRALRDAGSEVAVVRVPPAEDGSKQGIDDHLGRCGDRAARHAEMARLVGETQDQELETVRELNARWKLVLNGGSPYVLEGTHRYRLAAFDTLHAERRILATNLSGRRVEKRLTQWWRAQRACETYERVGFHTSRLRPAPAGELNLYREPVAPERYRAPSLAPVYAFLESQVPNADERRWLLAWAAYAVRYGERAHWAVFAWGPQGTGKTFLGALLGAAFVPYYRPVQIGDLTRENFGNALFECVRFLHADEGCNDDDKGRDLANKLKAPITQDRLRVEEKYVPSYEIDNRAMLYLSSNYRKSLYVEPSDRRWFALRVDARPASAVVRALNAWLRDSPSIDAPVTARASWALREHLERYEIPDGFDPDHAPGSTEKDEMIDAGRSAAERRVHELMHDGTWCGARMPEVVSAETLALKLLEPHTDRERIEEAANKIGRALGQAGCLRKVLKVDGHPVKRWAVRNIERWRVLGADEWRTEGRKLPVTVTPSYGG